VSSQLNVQCRKSEWISAIPNFLVNIYAIAQICHQEEQRHEKDSLPTNQTDTRKNWTGQFLLPPAFIPINCVSLLRVLIINSETYSSFLTKYVSVGNNCEPLKVLHDNKISAHFCTSVSNHSFNDCGYSHVDRNWFESRRCPTYITHSVQTLHTRIAVNIRRS